MKKKIGVIIATYNGQMYIKQQLESILRQTRKPDYIIVSDGKSEDNTVEICEEVLSNQNVPYMILTSERRLSVVDNFEKALSECKCEYIFFSDQDDVWLPNKIESIIVPMIQENACMAFSNAYIVDGNLKKVEHSNLWKTIGYTQKRNIQQYLKGDLKFVSELIKHNVVTGMCMCIKSDLKSKILPFSDKTMHDAWIALVAANCGKVLAINECLVLYRQHGQNVVGTSTNLKQMLKNSKKYKNKVQQREALIEELLKRIKNDITIDCKELLERYANFLHMRNNFLNQKENVFFVYAHKEQYRDYEYKHLQILVKDIISRNMK